MTKEQTDYKFTNECRKVFSHMKEVVVPLHPGRKIRCEHYILSIGDNKDCEAYRLISGLMLTENMSELWNWCIGQISKTPIHPTARNLEYDKIFDICLEELSKNDAPISSGMFLCSLMKHDVNLNKKMSILGVGINQIEHELGSESQMNEPNLNQYSASNDDKEDKREKSKKRQPKKYEKQSFDNGELDKYLVNISKMAADGNVDEAIGNDDVIEMILTSLLKRDKNNALLVGDVGSGKTTTVFHIANKINEGSVNSVFENKRLMLVDFMSLVSGTGFRGGFEAKYETVVKTAKTNGNCIMVIEDIHSILGQNSKFSEISTDMMLDRILSEKRIPCICTTTYEGYSKFIMSNEILNSRFEKIEMPKRDKEGILKIANSVKEKYELFHNVVITEEFVKNTIDYCERFLSNIGLSGICEILDLSASISRMSETEDEKLTKLKEELQDIEDRIDTMNKMTDQSKYEEYEILMKTKIAKKSEISVREKELNISKKKTELKEEHLLKALSNKTGLPIGELTKNDTEKLSSLSKLLKQDVIGQDEAVDLVSASVRRQRSGLSDRTKPQVFLFVGKTGCGKTLLAKKLSEKVYGSENNMVRLDMSEYSDKISVNKLTGASSGYIGYDDGGILTEAVKKNRHCIVLLDEIEKADNGVFDIFLQVFDEGRLTDNKGITVDFSDTIIIMTSNIGMKEIEDRGSLVGFNRSSDSGYDKDIILKTLKKRFKPEFLNRINSVVFFNPLTEDNIKEIIKLELKKVGKRVENAGYKLSNDVYDGKTFEKIFNSVQEEKEYGARPVIRTIERIVEDRLADLIIDGETEKGHMFTDEEINVIDNAQNE